MTIADLIRKIRNFFTARERAAEARLQVLRDFIASIEREGPTLEHVFSFATDKAGNIVHQA